MIYCEDLSMTWGSGGKLANDENIVNMGLSLTDACWNTYASTAYVIYTFTVGID